MKLFNTLSRQVESFEPQTAGEVKLYTCGPTVYNDLLIGNWVAYIRWDILVRTLQASGLKVRRVMNITDVGHLVSDADDGEDKMEKGAQREGQTAWEVAKKYSDSFMVGMSELNLLAPEIIAKATDHIEDQIELARKLEAQGYTYTISDGVYFDASKFADYPKFARLNLEEQTEGARVTINPEKHNAWDFALWKFSPKDSRRDMEWDSPWGKGFPGWHLECSAIAMKFLGETLDIHTGGIDHIPVHHTNEIAQSQSATGKLFSRFWLHNNFLLVDGTKISKSLGNGYTLDDLKQKDFSPLDFKTLVLQSHYRSESNFTWENLRAAQNRHRDLLAVAQLQFQPSDAAVLMEADFFTNGPKVILGHLQNDLDTPMAMAELSKQFDEIANNFKLHPDQVVSFTNYLQHIDELLGLDLFKVSDISDSAKELIQSREKARHGKDWQLSDTIREELLQQAVIVKDTAQGTVWSKE